MWSDTDLRERDMKHPKSDNKRSQAYFGGEDPEPAGEDHPGEMADPDGDDWWWTEEAYFGWDEQEWSEPWDWQESSWAYHAGYDDEQLYSREEQEEAETAYLAAQRSYT